MFKTLPACTLNNRIKQINTPKIIVIILIMVTINERNRFLYNRKKCERRGKRVCLRFQQFFFFLKREREKENKQLNHTLLGPQVHSVVTARRHEDRGWYSYNILTIKAYVQGYKSVQIKVIRSSRKNKNKFLELVAVNRTVSQLEIISATRFACWMVEVEVKVATATYIWRFCDWDI